MLSSVLSKLMAAPRLRHCYPDLRYCHAGPTRTVATHSMTSTSMPRWRADLELIIVDELAHSNPIDARHPKRYQDVEELIDAGIDVWTALNIQHIESLSDVVSAITGVTVRELVPDTVIENADDVVLVDITPDELIQRLKQGKVYLPENARRAADNFLQAGNITALRELALRRTAQRVDDQMVDYLRQRAIEGPWPSAERILVCVGGDVMAEQVVRAAARMANGLNATLVGRSHCECQYDCGSGALEAG